LPYLDRLRHAQVNGGIQDGDADMRFCNLSPEGSGVPAVTELLEPVHHVLRDAASVVSTSVFSAIEAFGFDLPQNGVARVVVFPPDRAISRRDGRPGQVR